MVQKSIISIQGSEIYYEVYGLGPTILIIHGWGVDHNLMSGSMEPIFQGRYKNYQRIYIDLPGMGKSTVSPSVRNSDDMLAVILEFIDRVIPGRDFLLAGESYGGFLSRGLLLKKHANIPGFLLLCSVMVPGFRKGTVAEHIVLEEDQDFLASLTPEDRSYFTYMSVVQTKPMWESFQRDIYPALLNQNKVFLETVLDGAFSKDINKEKLVYNKPALILIGRQDTEVGFKDQILHFIDFPRATIAVLDKSGHNLQIEQKGLFQVLVRDWLDRVSTF